MKISDHDLWSVRLGHWAGVPVRLHMLFLLFAVVTLYLSWLNGRAMGIGGVDGAAAMSLLVLFASVVCHELGHGVAASRLGGTMHESVLVPWGGLYTISVPHSAHAELITHLAGPLVNLMICLACLPPLIVFGEGQLLSLLHPLQPLGVDQGPLLVVLVKLTLWVNWLLVLVNLIPAYPFDGGRLLRASLARAMGRRMALRAVARIAQLAALGLVAAAWLVRDQGAGGVVPIWFALLLLAVFLFFSAAQEPERRERDGNDEELFGYDFSQGYTSLERSAESLEDDSPSPVAQWLEQRRRARQQRLRQQELEEERRVDEILARLHKYGMASLSDDDRALLERAAARYRSRLSDRQ